MAKVTNVIYFAQTKKNLNPKSTYYREDGMVKKTRGPEKLYILFETAVSVVNSGRI